MYNYAPACTLERNKCDSDVYSTFPLFALLVLFIRSFHSLESPHDFLFCELSATEEHDGTQM